MVNSVVQSTSSPPSYFAVWKENIPTVIKSLQQHPLMVGAIVVAAIADGIIKAQGEDSPLKPLAGLCGLVSAICAYFIMFTTMNMTFQKRQTGVADFVADNVTLQWRMVGMIWLFNVMCFVGLFCLVLPGCAVFVLFSMSVAAVALDGLTIREALGESLKLAKSDLMKTVWFCAIAPLILNIGYLAICFAGGFIIALAVRPFAGPFAALAALGGWLFYLTVAPPMVHLYAYLKENYRPA